jgi:predicted DNA binding CopG/RHH family protein
MSDSGVWPPSTRPQNPRCRQNKKGSVQIAIRLPEADLAQARKIAGRKGIGYQTLLKMLVHEDLASEAARG